MVGPKQVLKLLPRPSPEAVGADDGAVDTVDAKGVIPFGDVQELLEQYMNISMPSVIPDLSGN